MTARFFEDVTDGEELPGFQRRTDYMSWNRYAAVNDEFVYIHMDDEFGQLAGERGGFGMGNLRTAYLYNMARAWAGDEADVREVSVRFSKINNKNDVLTTHGHVVERRIEEGVGVIRIEAGVRNQDGEETCPAEITVILPLRSGPTVATTGPDGVQAPAAL